MKQMDAIDLYNTIMGGILSRLHIDYPDLYERYLKKWHPEEYEVWLLMKQEQE